ncbi:hypothetical protein ACIBCU_29110 [Streptomyces sp. NPDC051064]|uniref:hypothetical protein n=1 Tax=Streptomyces sp. NPDC051064 TaxID=3365641 RepID=UPI003788A6A6
MKIPDERGFAAKGELARGIVRRCLAAGLPAAWVTADEGPSLASISRQPRRAGGTWSRTGRGDPGRRPFSLGGSL